MRVTIDVDEKLWKEIMKHITEKYRTPYGKYRKAAINELLKIGLKEVKRTKNTEEFKKAMLSTKVSSEFLSFLENVSKNIRTKAKARK